MSQINVAFATDSLYIRHLSACIASLLSNNRQHSFRLFVLLADPPSAEVAMLTETVRKFGNAAISYVKVSPGMIAQFKESEKSEHITRSAYSRFFAAELLPTDVGRLLYLDCDTIICGDIGELFETDMRGYTLGAVEDQPDEHSNIGFSFDDKYFNSGVLLLDLERWRTTNTTSALLATASSDIKWRFAEQDILNLHFKNDWRRLHSKWNFHSIMAECPGWFNLSGSEFRALRNRPGIVHFTTKFKPWIYMYEIHYGGLYHRYLKRTPFRFHRAPDKTVRNRLQKFFTLKILKRKLRWLSVYVMSEFKRPPVEHKISVESL